VIDPDRELVERAQGELPYGTTSFDELVRRHSSRIYQRAYGILRSRPDAEEAAQDVFLAAFRNLPRYRFDRPFAHWLNVVTLNACRMLLRKRSQQDRKQEAVAEVGPLAQHPTPADPALRSLVLELLDELEPGTRIPLLMRFVEGYAFAEIAKELDLSESAAKMRVSRGARRLRELYEVRLEEAEQRRAASREESDDGQ
jgi:RNA polymerase sigma-70 factor (ECF subfamily)